MTTAHQPRYCSRCGHRLATDNPLTMCSPCQSASVDAHARPPAVPPEFWTLDQMRDALATWHMGRVIFAYRHHPYHRQTLPQEVVGTWLGLTQAQLSRIENGHAPEELSKLIRYSQIFGIPAELLWFDLPGSSRDRRTAEAVPPILLSILLGGREVLLPIDAEAAKATGLDEVIGDAVARTGDMPSSTTISAASSGRQAARILPFAGLDEIQHMAAALDDAHRYLDGSVVGFFGQQFERCKADDGRLGPLRVLPMVLGVLGAIQQHTRDVRPAVRRELLGVGADGAEFAGWLYRDLHDPASAAHWYDRAMEWAQEAQDAPMQAYVLVKKSQMAYDGRDLARTLTLAEAASRVCPAAPPSIQAELLQQEALALATHGEPLPVIERKLDAARVAFTESVPDANASGLHISTATLQLRAAAVYTEAGVPDRAAGIFADILAGGSLSHRDTGLFGARRAAALALSGHPDDAAAVGLDALQIARATSSGRTTAILSDVARTLTPWCSRPGPREFREAMLA
ncbi:helix-turn-helix transcriptional regulator [Frankia sp. Cr1]|uniref:helix-turn-helix transcriptional regulator n=1 Tax=Frankia sp. Cr1 TaxID=3073931 RepID=UPI002AD27282|nr:helix-turn-helix transcriptional regulator [Frankia sp. Cr1]